MAKLTPPKVREIRWYHAVGYSIRDIAKVYDVSPATISDIVHRKSHKRVLDEHELPPMPSHMREQRGSQGGPNRPAQRTRRF